MKIPLTKAGHPQTVRETFLALVEQGRPIRELEAEYLAIRGEDYPSVQNDVGRARGRARYIAFVAGINSLLGMPAHSDVSIDYILSNLSTYRAMSNGTFNGASNKFQRLLDVSDIYPAPNFCRDHGGNLREAKVIDHLIHTKSDCYALLMSALAHADAQGVNLLMGNASFYQHMSRETVLKTLSQQMDSHPELNLEKAFADYFKTNNNASFMASMKILCESTTATLDDFRKAFWPGADRHGIYQHVSEAVKFDLLAKPQSSYMLQVFRENGIDLYPGVVLREDGWGVYYDVVNEVRDPELRHERLLNFVSKNLVKNTSQNLAMLLIDIPLDKLKSHYRADLLLKHLYQETKDRMVLMAIEDKKFRGEMLEESLGM